MIIFLLLLIKIIFITSLTQKISKEYLNLISWIKNNNGYISNKLIPVEINKQNRYIESSQPINNNELLAYIPHNLIISSINRLVNQKCAHAYGIFHEQDFECLVFFLTLDKNNPNSFFKPYYDYFPDLDIKIFPREYSQEEINNYTEIGIKSYINHLNILFNRSYSDFVQKILLEEYNIKNIHDNFKYNFYFVLSRDLSRAGSETYPDLNSLCPFIDLFNHNNNFNVDWIYNEDKKRYELFSVKEIKKGEELTTNYGQLNNLHLLNVYGFVLKDNKYKINVSILVNGEHRYFLYYSDDDEEIIKNIDRIIFALKEIYIDKNIDPGSDWYIKNIVYAIYDKIDNLENIETNNDNIKEIILEEIDTLRKYLKVIFDYFIIYYK